ncbi:hypothetical protein Q0M94_22895 (plasmid) [Deinococcus radiomollis]|uniref:hypothetical protein n=1 Tax=Deinococcus radiomollis TaxID=468916 RepID=UPI003891C415
MTIPADHVLKALLQTGRLPVPEGHAAFPDHQAASAFEVDLLRLGFRLDEHARDRLHRLGTEELRNFYDRSLPVIRRAVGDARHRHLFLRFPHLVVEDLEYLRWRAWTWVRSEEGRAAERQGLPSALLLLEPCLHFVHRDALAGHGACPVCQVPVDRAGGEAFAPPEHQAEERRSPVRLLRGLNSEETALRELLRDGLGRRAPLAEHELRALRSAVPETPDSLLDRVLAPYLNGAQRVPGREALAQLTGTLLQDEDRRDLGLALLRAQLTSATDVLRACDVMGGGDGRLEDARGIGRSRARATRNALHSTFGSAEQTLADRQVGAFNADSGARLDGLQTLGEGREAIRLPRLGRPLRRAIMDLLEQRPAALLPEELHRHARAWTLLAERLHPLEDRRRANVVAAFTTLRGGLRGGSEVPLPTGAGYRMIRGKPRHHGLVSDIEWAYRNRDIALAWTLNARRPGLLGRGVDRLVRHSSPELLSNLSSKLAPAFSRLTLPMLLTLRGHLRGRTVAERENRSIRTRTGKVEVLPALPPLSPDVVAPIVDLLTDTLHRLPLSPLSPLRGLGVMQINAGCERLLVPLNLRTSSEALELVPSGSRVPLDLTRGAAPRLFVHWEEPQHSRVDLDLSAGFYDAGWNLVSTCSFHDLSPRLQGRRVGQHSGGLCCLNWRHGRTRTGVA